MFVNVYSLINSKILLVICILYFTPYQFEREVKPLRQEK